MKKWEKHENKVEKRFGGDKRPASGSIPGLKGDVVAGTLLIECKDTEKESYILKSSVWEKIAKEAAECRKEPLLLVCINGLRLSITTEDFLLTTLQDKARALESGSPAEEEFPEFSPGKYKLPKAQKTHAMDKHGRALCTRMEIDRFMLTVDEDEVTCQACQNKLKRGCL